MSGSVIVAGARTPIGKMSGALAALSAAELGGVAIAEALRRAGGVQVKAADLLGMSFRSFRYYVKKYNLR